MPRKNARPQAKKRAEKLYQQMMQNRRKRDMHIAQIGHWPMAGKSMAVALAATLVASQNKPKS